MHNPVPLDNEAVRRDDSFLQGVKECIPTLLGYLSIGIAVGVIAKTVGFSMMEIFLMSLLVYAGSAQFIIAGMIASGGSITAIILTVFIVNVRHVLLSAALSPYFKWMTPAKSVLIGSLITDETFGVAINKAAKQKQISERWMHGLNITAYLNWIAATLAGAWLGEWITEPERFGLDFALPAMFIGLLVLQLTSRKKIVKDLLVVGCTVLVLLAASYVVSGSIAVMIATIAAATVGMVIEKWK